MNIAIIGPGRRGTTLAYHLARGGHQITMMGRGKRLAELQRDKAIVTMSGERVPVAPAASLDVSVPYDLVLVPMFATQVASVLPMLQDSAAKTIVGDIFHVGHEPHVRAT